MPEVLKLTDDEILDRIKALYGELVSTQKIIVNASPGVSSPIWSVRDKDDILHVVNDSGEPICHKICLWLAREVLE